MFIYRACVHISDNAITIEDGTFTWDEQLGPCLKEYAVILYLPYCYTIFHSSY